ncbi:D-isomer specific 2-hydroxyacid dehydrogenase NAD-binding [Solidesulfovibrio fructosivorans JJ]]|uniref:D-isomer specific 2-hydroxyacid dehydrogenase NAD-binding n=1 Tax=Solidesulfovibrio fructosivorans JJ] TaxID=596151 RepID=E1JWS3_SOLFR|nr:D-glycerate dehydrogenase [Solidesulfovibrio fructosivorans]EFL51127.1 D-isomer specific 2-hydroxyacid dehydrogenase NAD-binding [Solidesulfovibrio fructosivorans JJ]]
MAKRPSVIVTRRIPKAGLSLLRETCDVWVNPEDRPLDRAELLQHAATADGVIGLLTDRIDSGFFDAAPLLRGYANYAVGFDNIDVAEATRRGVPVSNTPDVLTTATAELAWALVFAVARQIVVSDAVMRSGNWPGWGPLQFIGQQISGKTLGIFGPGRIGTAMALMARGFAMPVVTCGGRRPNETLERECGAKRLPFEEFLATADIISIHAPLTPETRHAFNAAALARLKPTAILVNTGRGPIIDEAALVVALREKRLAGAGLDVYEFEPKMAVGLAALPNVVVTPHIGSATSEARDGMAELAARNLLAMLAGDTPPTCLNPEVLPDRGSRQS